MSFSTFTAISELFVTTGDFYIIYTNLRGQPFPWKLALGVALFEFSVNMLYMISRMSRMPAANPAEPNPLAPLYALHGSLSLLVFIAFVVMTSLAYVDYRKGRFYFREHRVATAVFVVFWLVSVGSGEAIYFLNLAKG